LSVFDGIIIPADCDVGEEAYIWCSWLYSNIVFIRVFSLWTR